MFDTASARRWARGGLVLGVASSIAGNLADTLLTVTTVSVYLRGAQAVFWPILLFVAVEIMIRMKWPRNFLGVFGQLTLICSGVPAFVTSFSHLRDLLIKSNERGIVQLMGPLAIDLCMVGSTVALLVIRSAHTLPRRSPGEALNAHETLTPDVLSSERSPLTGEQLSKGAWWSHEQKRRERSPLPDADAVPDYAPDWEALPPAHPDVVPTEAPWVDLLTEPDAPWPVSSEHPVDREQGVSSERPVNSRKPVSSERPLNIAHRLVAGEHPVSIARETGAGVSTVRRYARALKLIREQADVSTLKIHPEAEQIFREHS